MSASVLVVGAGPSGLSLALALLQNGVSVRVIEKKPEPLVGQKGSAIQPRTLELHQFLGTLSDLEKTAKLLPEFHVYRYPGGTEVLHVFQMFDVIEPTTACPRPNTLKVSQEMQEKVLREHLEKHGCRVEFGVELVGFEQSPDSVVVHVLKNGGNEPETLTFHWLVGADGASSTVRKQLGIPFVGETRKTENMVIGDIWVKKGLSHDYWHAWGVLPFKMVALGPYETADGRFGLTVSGTEIDQLAVASSREELIKTIYEITNRRDIEFGDVITLANWRPNVRMVNELSQGRVFIAGDAAHAHSPTGGQGTNSGIQDAINLAWKLALVEKGLAPQRLLNSYTQERVPVIAAMLSMTTTLLDKSLAPKVGGWAGFYRGHEFKQLGVTYRGSPIVVDVAPSDDAVDPYRSGEDGKLRAGDRAPDATVGLHALFGTAWHTVLVFGDDKAEEILDVAKELKAPVRTVVILPKGVNLASDVKADRVLEDVDGSAFENYKVSEQEGRLFVVRPDGVVGARVDNVEGLRKYFKLVFIQ